MKESIKRPTMSEDGTEEANMLYGDEGDGGKAIGTPYHIYDQGFFLVQKTLV